MLRERVLNQKVLRVWNAWKLNRRQEEAQQLLRATGCHGVRNKADFAKYTNTSKSDQGKPRTPPKGPAMPVCLGINLMKLAWF